MKNTEKVVSLLVGSERVTGRDYEGQSKMAHYLNAFLTTDGEKRIKSIVSGVRLDRLDYALCVIKVMFICCPEDCELIYAELLATLHDLKNTGSYNQYLEDFYIATIIGSTEGIVWLDKEKQVTQASSAKFFKFLTDFIYVPSSVSFTKTMDSTESGRFSNLSGPLCKVVGADTFFRDLNKRNVGNICQCAEQILTELSFKKFMSLSLEDRVKIASIYPNRK